MIRIYSLNESSPNLSFYLIPGFVAENLGKEGYYTLLSVDEKDEGDEFIGIIQFYVDMAGDELYFSELIYVYVEEKYRLKDMGLMLVHKVNEILKAQGVDVIVTNIPYNEEGVVISDISEEEIEVFFRECGFIIDKDKSHERPRHYKLTRR